MDLHLLRIRLELKIQLDEFTMNLTNNTTSYNWTPSEYGDYNLQYFSKNSVEVETVVNRLIKIAISTPPTLALVSPKTRTSLRQLNFSPIPISFNATATDHAIASITLKDLVANTSTPVSVTTSTSYSVMWTPQNYGLNDLELIATDIRGTSRAIQFKYTVANPAIENVSFENESLYQIKAVNGIQKAFVFDKVITSVKSRNLSLTEFSFANTTLTVNSNNPGRTGLEITTEDGEKYYIGLRIDNADGTVTRYPTHISVGSVSEDIPDDVNFFNEGINNDNLLLNNRMDVRYTYINGGPLIGWNTWQPDRVIKFARNSLKMGQIPFFIFYNIPDGGESYTTNLGHIQSPEYMTAYFENLELFLNQVKDIVGDEFFGVIFEPDFLGYMQQNTEPPTLSTSVSATTIGQNAGTLKTLVERINSEIDKKRIEDDLNLEFGWQLNLWAKPNVAGLRGIIRETDNVNGVGGGDFETQIQKIKQTAIDIYQYGNQMGIMSSNADFISIDKYGLDALGYSNESEPADPSSYTWFWNNDHWLNYYEFVKTLAEESDTHVVLWQITVGHINNSTSINEYTGTNFVPLVNKSKHYEDSASPFFFGDEIDFSNDQARFDYFSQNKHNDPKLISNPTNKHVTFGNHFAELNGIGVKLALMGAGVGDSTDGIGDAEYPGATLTDDHFWIQKVQDYYINHLTESTIENNLGDSDQIVSIDGSVKENDVLLSNVDVILKSADDQELDRVSSSDGHFTFSAVIAGLDYTLVVEKDYYSFTELVYTDLTDNQRDQLLEGTIDTHTISGEIVSGSGSLEGVTVTVSGGDQDYTSITDASGHYSITGLLAGLDYIVTPSLDNIVLLPMNSQVRSLDTNKVFNFSEDIALIYGVVLSGRTPVVGAKLKLVLTWADSTHLHKTLVATTNAQGKYFFTETQLSGYSAISSFKLNFYENNYVQYLPVDLVNIAVPSSPTEYNFNSESVLPAISPEITINKPNQSTIRISQGSTVDLEALVGLGFEDASVTISTVVFELDDVTLPSTLLNNLYTATWTPLDTDIGNSHTFKVTAESSNGVSSTELFRFDLECSGSSCPNVSPSLSLSSPSVSTINQISGFESIPIEVTASDSDGTISTVTILINGTTVAMTAGLNDTYVYRFTPSAYQSYPMVITALDDRGSSTVISETITVTNTVFTPLPSGNIVLGYAHSWEHASAPFLYFNDMLTTKYNIVAYSFIETVDKNGYTPLLTINSNRYQTNGAFDPQLLKDDINSLRDQGIPVIVSIGGQNGHVELNTVAEKNEFVEGLKNIVDEYGFDGIDLDFEGGSMDFGAGALTDFSYEGISAFQKLKNVVDAFKEIKQYYGSNFILTAAPETQYVQGGYSAYSNTWGSFLPIIHNLRDELDLLMVQLYNTGSVNALDGQAYNSAIPDFLVSMSDMLINGFDVASTGFHFDGLPASKIMVGIPACPSAAGSGYIQPTEAIKALDYMRFGTTFFGRNYNLQDGVHPDLRGVMTWSINWDVAAGCAAANEFSDSYSNYFNYNPSARLTSLSIKDQDYMDVFVYPIPINGILNIASKKN